MTILGAFGALGAAAEGAEGDAWEVELALDGRRGAVERAEPCPGVAVSEGGRPGVGGMAYTRSRWDEEEERMVRTRVDWVIR